MWSNNMFLAFFLMVGYRGEIKKIGSLFVLPVLPAINNELNSILVRISDTLLGHLWHRLPVRNQGLRHDEIFISSTIFDIHADMPTCRLTD